MNQGYNEHEREMILIACIDTLLRWISYYHKIKAIHGEEFADTVANSILTGLEEALEIELQNIYVTNDGLYIY